MRGKKTLSVVVMMCLLCFSLVFLVSILDLTNEKDLKVLINALDNKDWSVREVAAQALDKIEPNWRSTEAAKKQVSYFIRRLGDSKRWVRETAAEALGEIGDKRAVEPLITPWGMRMMMSARQQHRHWGKLGTSGP